MILISALMLATLVATSAASDESIGFTDSEKKRILQHSPLGPVPPDPTNSVADSPDAARLGQFLFFDKKLSGNREISCATCHDPTKAFADGLPIAKGISVGTRNTPALWNVAYNRWFFWDGRADSLWSQPLSPIEGAHEMGASRLSVLHRIASDREVRKAYEAVFGALPDVSDSKRFPLDARPVPGEADHPHQRAWMAMSAGDRDTVDRVFANVGKAIAAYQRRIVSRGAPFDRFVEGLQSGDAEKLRAISPSAQRGLKLFVGRGNCRLCHTGPNFTSGEFHELGVPPNGGGPLRDSGRFAGIELVKADVFNAAGVHSDARSGPAAEKVAFVKSQPGLWGQFKTPSLRNVAKTAPYMHAGQMATLRDVLRFYSTREGAVAAGHHAQESILVPLHFTDEEIDDLLAFLEALTDTALGAELTKAPDLSGSR